MNFFGGQKFGPMPIFECLNKLCSLHVSNQISFSSVVREIAAHCTENKFKQRFEMKLFHNTVNMDFEE